MPPTRLPRVKPGEPIRAEHFNVLMDLAESLGLTVATGSDLNIRGGVLTSTRKVGRWLRLTAVSGTGLSALYAWTGVVRSGSAWVDTAYAGTFTDNPARRANGTSTLTLPMIVWGWQETAGEVLFQSDDC